MIYEKISGIANGLILKYDSRDPFEISQIQSIHILYKANFDKLKGMYKVIKRSRFIFINSNLNHTVQKIVCAHELGHDMLHRDLAVKVDLQEYDLYRLDTKTELEANIFAAELLIDTDELLELIKNDYSTETIARTLYTDINLLALKVRLLIQQGYNLRMLDHKSDFLKY
jgi:Zn-dependent peptidase ImmA (M78 family)